MSHHDNHDHANTSVIDEKSLQDKFLSALAVLVLVGLFGLGCYWQSLSLPSVHTEEEAVHK